MFCERRELRLHTEFRDRGVPFEFTKVVFTGVAAYDFWHDSDGGTIIFDVAEIEPADIYAAYAEQFRTGVRYGWPGEWATSVEAATAHFHQHAIRGYELQSSCGMSGWILARAMHKHLVLSASEASSDASVNT